MTRQASPVDGGPAPLDLLVELLAADVAYDLAWSEVGGNRRGSYASRLARYHAAGEARAEVIARANQMIAARRATLTGDTEA